MKETHKEKEERIKETQEERKNGWKKEERKRERKQKARDNFFLTSDYIWYFSNLANYKDGTMIIYSEVVIKMGGKVWSNYKH